MTNRPAQPPAMTRTLVILNPNAANGRVRQLWQDLQPLLVHQMGDISSHFTTSEDEVAAVVAAAYADGVRRVVAVGGDGTSHSVVGAVIAVQDAHPHAEPIAYATVPVGTGRDWVRTLGTPHHPQAAIERLGKAVPQRIDVGEFICDDAPPEPFLNIGSIGLGGCVGARVNALQRRYPWSFMQQTITCILSHRPQRVSITADGETAFDARTYIALAANGGYFGHGMHIAPLADIHDGQLDLVAVAGVSRLELLGLFAQVYSGRHLRNPKVTHRRAREIVMTGQDGPLSLELDGETRTGTRLVFRVRPAGLMVLR